MYLVLNLYKYDLIYLTSSLVFPLGCFSWIVRTCMIISLVYKVLKVELLAFK